MTFKSFDNIKTLIYTSIKRLRELRLYILMILIRLLFIILLLFLILRPANPNPEIRIVSKDLVPVITYSVEIPEEEPTSNGYTWQGSTVDPKLITIPSINLSGYVINVGVDQNKEIAVPPNVHLAGWFVDSVRPGEKGLSIIDGHVDGLTVGGIFKNLNKLNKGDEIVIEMGSNDIYKYKVKDIKTIPLNEAAGVLFSQDPTIVSQLNLITCIGTYLDDQRTYDHRLVVISELID